jgi:hypothetical protein
MLVKPKPKPKRKKSKKEKTNGINKRRETEKKTEKQEMWVCDAVSFFNCPRAPPPSPQLSACRGKEG